MDARHNEIESGIKDRRLLLERRDHVAEVATRMIASRGFAHVSVNEIAHEAGISVGSLYKYVRTKEDILWLVMEDIYSRLEGALKSVETTARPAPDAMRDVLGAYLLGVDSLRDGILLMYREWPNLPREARRHFMERERNMLDVFLALVETGISSGEFTCPDPVICALNIMMTGRTWVLKGWILSNVPLEEYIRRQTAAALEMLGIHATEVTADGHAPRRRRVQARQR